ncbi:hypothetical protein [Stakelama saccharophila]|uniref:Protein NO VEIN C-terminal domain-containing protein n=1 Tax=Stakelama saccharophila TaxID=3075605 RepID=A0ABZ0B793_9SPHN|nr:hypothetical protein [Stakelama sp. W311]WNO53164.1 hypothetical protein RPR59_12015 [Stakelama sp. W311]
MKQTNENLSSDAATKALMRWLVAAALDNSFLTYGEAKLRLEQEVGFDRIARAGRTGLTAGTMIDKLLRADPSAPLLNALLVEQDTELPSDGAGWYLANRFDEPLLRRDNAKNLYRKLWRRTFDRAAGEVYSTPRERWQSLFQAAYGEPLNAEAIRQQRKQRKAGTEEDGIRYGRNGEGPNHEALRLWVCENPSSIRRKFRSAVAETEVVLDSADRVDAVFRLPEEVVAIEVKSRDSNLIDLRRGVFQCIKYRAVLDAMDIRQAGVVSAMLVTETEIPGEIRALLKAHGIAHYQAPMDRK